jgi:acyl-CoA thioesterase YciA
MIYRTRKMVAPKDLNAIGTLFGGRVLDWIDEEAYIYVSCQLDSMNVVTKTIGRIDFIHGAKHGDIVEIGMETIAMGRSSITVKATIRNMKTLKVITQVDDIVFVNIKDGKPFSHGKQI